MQAIIYPITPFDVTVGGTIRFSWNGHQAFKNRCIIRDNQTNDEVYNQIVETFKLEHPINIAVAHMVNGRKYNVYLTVIDKDGVESDIQTVPTPLLCFATPVFKFANCSNGEVITSSSYRFVLDYQQQNGEPLNSWSISIYNKTHDLQTTSGIQYNANDTSYTFSGFSNKMEYYVRAEGHTVNGIALDTGYVLVSITYDISNIFSLLEPTNIPELGAIQLRTNITSVDGSTTKPPIYIDDDYIDLTDDIISFLDGVSIKDNFSVVVKGYNIIPNKPLVTLLSDDRNTIMEVFYRVLKDANMNYIGYFELKVTSNGVVAIHNSNYIEDVSIGEVPLYLDGSRDLTGKYFLTGYDLQPIFTGKNAAFVIMRHNGLFNIEATAGLEGSGLSCS